jgi:predicted P-loop ATPase
MTIHYFETVKSREARETTLEALVQSILHSDALRAKTENYRNTLAENKTVADRMKKTFAGFLPAARVDGRRLLSNVTALTGLVMCDFDHVPADQIPSLRARANADPHTLFTYVTLSAQGLRILACYNHEEAIREVTDKEGKFSRSKAQKFYYLMFEAVNKHYARLLGLDYDPACKDLTRMSLAAFDAEAYFQPSATPFTMAECGITTLEEREQEKAEKRRLNKAVNQISRTYQYRVEPMMKQEGAVYEAGKHNNYVMRVGYVLNKYGFELNDVMEWATKQFPDYPEAANTIKYCYNRTEEHGEWADQVKSLNDSVRGKIPQAMYNEILEFMQRKCDIRRNLVLGRPEMRWKDPVYEGIASPHSSNRHAYSSNIDPIVNTLIYQMESECMRVPKKDWFYTVLNSDKVEEFDPLSHYLHSLPKWDPDRDPDYLQQLADTVKIKDPDPRATDLWQRCLKKWMVWMLVGWLRPDQVNQTILYLIGAQGTYKSTWCTSLLPPELSDYLKIKQNSSEMRTDDLISMSSYALIVHEEVDAMSQREINTLKAMVTAKYSDERAPYARSPQRRLNIASLCATGNNEQFLTNDQGTRRSLVFRVESIQSPIDHPFPYEGIYSQAYYLMNNGFQYYFSPAEQAELEEHNHQFEVANYEEAAIFSNLCRPGEGIGKLRWLTATQVAELLSARSGSHHTYDANKVGKILTRLEYPKTIHKGHAGYKVVVRDYDEVERVQQMQAQEVEEPQEAPKDIQEAPPTVQDMYRRLLGEKDEE